MRTRLMLSIAIAALVIQPARASESETFGAGVSLSQATPIARILERPSDFEGKTVRVEGVVSAVCTEMGCWMALAPDATANSTVLIKVDDGVIVFPVSAKGRRAAAQGLVQRVGNDAEGRAAAAEHAKQEGRTGPGAWQIKATGAVVF